MDILSIANVNMSVVIIINLLTWLVRTKLFPLIKPYSAFVVLGLGVLYGISESLISGIDIFHALENGFLTGAVASYVYSLWKRPSESKPARRIGDKVRGLINP